MLTGSGMTDTDASLAGVRVLDFSRVLAGPYATQTLAEMGADVVKVEWSDGDSSRQIGPFLGDRSLYFSALNGGKRSVLLDPTVDTDATRITELDLRRRRCRRELPAGDRVRARSPPRADPTAQSIGDRRHDLWLRGR